MGARKDHKSCGRMVTTRTAGQIAGASTPTLRRLIHAGDLRAHRVGKCAHRVKLTDVQEFVERRQVAPDPMPPKVSTARREARYGAAQ